MDQPNSGVTTALIGLLRGMLWPAVVIGIMYNFSAPLFDILTTLSQNLKSAQSIDLGYVKITVRESKISPPERDVGIALSKLDRTLLETILNHPSDTGYHICLDSSNTYDTERKRKYDRLVAIELARYEEGNPANDYCKEKTTVVWLTELAKETKAYFTRVVLEQITLSKT